MWERIDKKLEKAVQVLAPIFVGDMESEKRKKEYSRKRRNLHVGPIVFGALFFTFLMALLALMDSFNPLVLGVMIPIVVVLLILLGFKIYRAVKIRKEDQEGL